MPVLLKNYNKILNNNINSHPIPEDSNLTGYIMVEQVKSVDFRTRCEKRIEHADDELLTEVLSILTNIATAPDRCPLRSFPAGEDTVCLRAVKKWLKKAKGYFTQFSIFRLARGMKYLKIYIFSKFFLRYFPPAVVSSLGSDPA